MNISSHFGVKPVTAVQIPIKSDDVLQAIYDHFECATTLAAEQEFILDCIQLGDPGAKDQLRVILKLPNYVFIPTEGYLVFWKA